MQSTFDAQRQDSLKRRWQERRHIMGATPIFFGNPNNINTDISAAPQKFIIDNKIQGFHGFNLEGDDLVSTVVPPVTVVLEGRSICQRISLHNHASYSSLAKALRQMFVDGDHAASAGGSANSENGTDEDLDLSNAIPGHLIAYEDMENDLLLAGDLNWKDFIRVAKRIRILPAKTSSRKGTRGAKLA
ncbi:Auxin-responsive protein [Quillaja saponaria]|uniref:Auxin-induced protein n=1 Tax=Quillaja saponaria TaxID=32244 RepID=A0AAD7QDV3_QUISA|nr:Auxin-responsive protein [Quillaja saponaria]KAJ7979463.1 Auxin-responsive protein [Quillaja saponaria]